eukprot:m.18179 g.18179  ORF g.18179 m.18179 type:complete len:52 (+) comp7706_c0_seq1:2249-2404(+)
MDTLRHIPLHTQQHCSVCPSKKHACSGQRNVDFDLPESIRTPHGEVHHLNQ